MKNLLKFSIAFFAMGLILAGCYPGGAEYTADYDLVVSDYKPDYWDKTNPKFYYMPDTVAWISDREDPENSDTLPREEDEFILGEVERNLTALGYTRVERFDSTNPTDLAVLVQALAVKNTSVYYPYYPYYGGGYWGGYWPYYGYGYPVVYSYSTGTVLIEMIDTKNIDVINKRFDVVWISGIDGLLRNTKAENAAYVSDLIGQAFKQSPYLKP